MEQCYYILIKIQLIKMKPLFVFSKYKKHIIFLTHKAAVEGKGILDRVAISHARSRIVIAAKQIGAPAVIANNMPHIYSYKKVLNIICYNKIHILYNKYPG